MSTIQWKPLFEDYCASWATDPKQRGPSGWGLLSEHARTSWKKTFRTWSTFSCLTIDLWIRVVTASNLPKERKQRKARIKRTRNKMRERERTGEERKSERKTDGRMRLSFLEKKKKIDPDWKRKRKKGGKRNFYFRPSCKTFFHQWLIRQISAFAVAVVHLSLELFLYHRCKIYNLWDFLS